MRSLTLVILAVNALGSPLVGQDWREQLRSDFVTVADGKMTYDEVGIMTLALPGWESFRPQIKTYSEAPATGFMSRDAFVGITSTWSLVLLLGIYADAAQVTAGEFMEAFDFTELRNPIGNPDLELNLFMTEEGCRSRW